MSSGYRLERLLAVLGHSGDLDRCSLRAWSKLVAAARAARLLGELADEMHSAGVQAPPPVRRHLDGALQLAQRQSLSVRWELHCLDAVFASGDIPVVLLKGAAYATKGLALARGRMFGDIDILVPRATLGVVETRLMIDGWVSVTKSAYDQRYYRDWMHELPPMQHIRRGSVLDIHHTILPLTARNAPDPAAIIDRAHRIEGFQALHLPAAQDLLVHSLTHLVHEGELDASLRDLYDVDAMVRTFSAEPDFWPRLNDASLGNDLAGPVWLGLQLARTTFDTPVPEEVMQVLAGQASRRWTRSSLIEGYRRALCPDAAHGTLRQRWARHRIYVRAHALRMPLPLLLRHLTVKAWMNLMPEAAQGRRPDL